MKVDAIDHLHLNVRDLGKAMRLFAILTGAEYHEPLMIEELKAWSNWNMVGLELLQPASDDSPIARAIARRGEGATALSFGVTDIESKVREAEALGLRVVSRIGYEGMEAQAQFHPKDSFGVMVELVERLAGYPERPVDAFHQSVDHIHIFVKDLERAIELFTALTGAEFTSPVTSHEGKVRTSINALGLDLTQPTSPDSSIAQTIAKRGEGAYAIAFRATNIEEGIAKAQSAGLKLVSRIGYEDWFLQAQFDQRDSFGVMVEFVENRRR